MEYRETDLRQALSSPGAGREGRQILERIDQGDVVVIAKQDGSTLTLSESSVARRVLRDLFDWPHVPTTEE